MDKGASQSATYEAGALDLTQFTQRAITVPPSDEYFLVSADKLARLDEYRMSWAMEGCLGFGGVALGSVVAAVTGLENGLPENAEAFWSAVLCAAALLATIIFGVICYRSRHKFSKLMTDIKSGKRLVSTGGIIVEAKSSEKTNDEKDPEKSN